MKGFVVTACVLCASASFGLALWTCTDVSMFGFPDGYLTAYQHAVRTPLMISSWLMVGLGLLFVALGCAPLGTRERTIAWFTASLALALVAATAWFGIPWYAGTHLGLDNGVGG
ncbi:hypothetical protein EV589_1981 [Mycobacterium sp. BK558]|nr:hypothetical protein EV589_1981 [Mycobacterium sp. BK558]